MFEKVVRTTILIASFGFSGVLTMMFAASLGTDIVSSCLLGGVGLLFEVFKGLAWYQAGKRKVAFILLGCLAGFFSFIASLAYASMTLEDGWENSETVKSQLASDGTMLDELKKEEAALIDDMSRLPPDWVTSNLKYAAELKIVRSEEASLQTKRENPAKPTSTSAVAMSLARRIGWNGGLVLAGLLGFMSLILEIGIAVLSLNMEQKHFPLRRPEEFDEVARFLRESIGPNRLLLGRRDLVAKGWSERDVRRLTTQLVGLGVLVHRKGRGLELQT